MPAPKQTIRRRDPMAEQSPLLRAWWNGDPPPAGLCVAADRELLIAAVYFADLRREYAKAGCAFARTDSRCDDHPHLGAWHALLDLTRSTNDEDNP